MRYLALDWGKKRIGTAKGDDETGIAFPDGILRNTRNFFNELRALCQKEKIGALVIGIPKTLRGEYGPQAKEIFEFIAGLKKSFSLPIFLEDERFTTKIAARIFGPVRRTHMDAISAALILQSFFDKKKKRSQN